MASQDWLEKDFYQILGVAKDVSDSELKKRYRSLARQYHPDSNPGNATAEARFKEISEAFSVLSDKEQRAEYDQIRAMGAGGARFTAGGSNGQGFEDIFGGMFGGGGRYSFHTGGNRGGYEDLFHMFGGGSQPPSGPQPGRNLAVATTLDFETAVRGDTVAVQTPGGSVRVKIPAGVEDGKKIRARGKGAPSPDGGSPGDLILTVHVRKHPVFEREGNNLRLRLPVSFVEATLGATVEVPTLGGEPVKLKIPPGTPSGRVLRIKGRGVHAAQRSGDLLAEVQVAVPVAVGDEAKVALLAFDAAMPAQNPRTEILARARA